MAANDKQVGGGHYGKPEGKPQHWDWAADMPYLEGRCTAYVERHARKNGAVDVLKAAHFLQKIMEVRYDCTLDFILVDKQGRAIDDFSEMVEVMLSQDKTDPQNPYANIEE